MDNKLVSAVLGAAALTGTAIAGEVVAQPEASSFCVCDSLKSIGTLYKSDSNPYLQEVKLFGRAQYQWGYTDGDNDGDDFSGNGDELRRLRVGMKAKFLNGFTLKANIDLEDGGYRSHELGYNEFDVALLSYNFGDVLGFEDTTVAYGRHKHTVTQEAHTSSKKIKTIERSNISNFFYGSARPTGVSISGKHAASGVKGKLAVYSTEDDSEFVGGWNDGTAVYGNLQFDCLNGAWNLDAFYNDADNGSEDDEFGYKWATSAAYTTEISCWELMVNGVIGELDSSDTAYGVVIMPSTYLIEEKLEFVARYQYAGATSDVVKINSRNVRNTAKYDGLGVESGDSNHTIYAGLNYFLCGHNAKVMAGIEYETLDGSDVDLEATTLWTGFRMYF